MIRNDYSFNISRLKVVASPCPGSPHQNGRMNPQSLEKSNETECPTILLQTPPTVPHTSSLSLPGWGRMILPAIKRYTHAEMPLVVGQMRLHSCSRPTEISTNSLLNHRWWESSSFTQQEYKSPQWEPSKQNGITSVKASNKAQREHLLFSFSTRRHLHRINVSQIVSTTMPLGWKHSRFQALMPFDETTKAIHGNEKTARPFTAHKAAAIPIDSLDVVESLNTCIFPRWRVVRSFWGTSPVEPRTKCTETCEGFTPHTESWWLYTSQSHFLEHDDGPFLSP